MSLPFDEAKATQLAARILSKRGGQMHYIKLLKLMYLVDREALLRWGIPVSTDKYVSMDNGPVLSRVLNLITEEMPKPQWSQFISPPMGDYEVTLLNPPQTDRLSRAEEKLIDEVYEKYGHWNRWKLIEDVMHKFPEWEHPQGSSKPLPIRAILKAGGESEEEIKATLKELEAVRYAEETFSRA